MLKIINFRLRFFFIMATIFGGGSARRRREKIWGEVKNHQFLATIFFHHDYDFGGGQKSSIFGIVVYGRSLTPVIMSNVCVSEVQMSLRHKRQQKHHYPWFSLNMTVLVQVSLRHKRQLSTKTVIFKLVFQRHKPFVSQRHLYLRDTTIWHDQSLKSNLIH